jgi:L-ribulokinase
LRWEFDKVELEIMKVSLGIDYGPNSVRALLVRCRDGKELGSCVVGYPSGREGILLDPRDHNLARRMECH